MIKLIPLVESRFDNSIYIKPANLRKIGWMIIKKGKSVGRPIYALYDDDPQEWGATYRMGSGQYGESDKLFYTIPIKIEQNNKFSILEDDESWSRSYKYYELKLDNQ